MEKRQEERRQEVQTENFVQIEFDRDKKRLHLVTRNSQLYFDHRPKFPLRARPQQTKRQVEQNQLAQQDQLAKRLQLDDQSRQLVCVTCYNQSREALQATLEGLKKNTQNRLMVIVVFDGIQKINMANRWQDGVHLYLQQKSPKFKQHLQRILELKKLQTSLALYPKALPEKRREIERNPVLVQLIEQQYKKMEGNKNATRAEVQQKISKLVQQFLQSLVYKIDTYFASLDHTSICIRDRQVTQQNLEVFYLIKHRNAQKINSHMWYFYGFCRWIKPRTCAILDCGLVPEQGSLNTLQDYIIDNRQTVGGVCGHMKLVVEHSKSNNNAGSPDVVSRALDNLFSVQRAQQFEYLYAHVLDKNFESFFGYIHVLPGAYSVYQWESLDDNQDETDKLLEKYFKTQKSDYSATSTIEQENLFLAQDRIFCLQIFTKKNKKYKLVYLEGCEARVDSMKTVQDLLGQRRRWSNGSFFALNYVLQKYSSKVEQSGHDCLSRFKFRALMKISYVTRALGYFSLALYSLMYFLMLDQVTSAWVADPLLSQMLFAMLIVGYLSVILVSAVRLLSLQVLRDVSFFGFSQWLGLFGLVCGVFTILNLVEFFLLLNYAVNDPVRYEAQLAKLRLPNSGVPDSFIRIIPWLGAASILVYILPVLISGAESVSKAVRCFPDFMFYSPTMAVLVPLVSFSHIDNLSWGTKGLTSSDISSKKKSEFRERKFSYFMEWLTSNLLVLLTLVFISYFKVGRFWLMFVLLVLNIFYVVFKLFFALLNKCVNQYTPHQNELEQSLPSDGRLQQKYRDKQSL